MKTITTVLTHRDRTTKLIGILVAANISFTREIKGSLRKLNIIVSEDVREEFVKVALNLTGIKIDFIS